MASGIFLKINTACNDFMGRGMLETALLFDTESFLKQETAALRYEEIMHQNRQRIKKTERLRNAGPVRKTIAALSSTLKQYDLPQYPSTDEIIGFNNDLHYMLASRNSKENNNMMILGFRDSEYFLVIKEEFKAEFSEHAGVHRNSFRRMERFKNELGLEDMIPKLIRTTKTGDYMSNVRAASFSIEPIVYDNFYL